MRLETQRLTAQLFDTEEHQETAIGNRKREQVHHAEVNANKRKEHEEILESAHPHIAHHSDDRNRAGERINLDLSLEQALEIAEDARRHFPARGASLFECFNRTATHKMRFTEHHIAHLDAHNVALEFFIVSGSHLHIDLFAITQKRHVDFGTFGTVNQADNIFIARNVLAVDFKNCIALRNPCFLSSGTFFRRKADNHAVARVNADISNAHFNGFGGRIRRRNHEFLRNNLDG